MLKALFGSYAAKPPRPQPNWRVLDVGCGSGNNLLPFADLGCECHGVEISDDITERISRVIADRGIEASLATGSNRSLPYPDGHFDLLLSVNAIHYEGSAENIRAALAEFRRVLKPTGHLYISTVGPEHAIQQRAEALGHHRYRIQDYDFRNGETFFFFETESYLSQYCSEFFDHVETGRVTEKLMEVKIDFLVALCG